jgi:hypothetical protein
MSDTRVQIVEQFRAAVQLLAEHFASEERPEQGGEWATFLLESVVRYADDHSLELICADIEQYIASRHLRPTSSVAS